MSCFLYHLSFFYYQTDPNGWKPPLPEMTDDNCYKIPDVILPETQKMRIEVSILYNILNHFYFFNMSSHYQFIMLCLAFYDSFILIIRLFLKDITIEYITIIIMSLNHNKYYLSQFTILIILL